MTLETLMTPAQPLTPDALGAAVFDRFEAEPDTLGLAVVDAAGRPVGFVERVDFMLKMGSSYGRPLYAGRPISIVMDTAPLVVEAGASIPSFTGEVLARCPSDLLRGFIIVRDGLYAGVGATLDLLQAASDENRRQATALRDLTAALRLARDQAESSSRAKTEFLANMSHEIRTPLNGVTGVVSVLAQTPLSAPQREMVQIIQDSAVTLELLLSDVLDLARVESGRIDLRQEPFQIEAAARRCASLFRLRAEQKGLAFQVEIDPGAMGYRIGDPARLQQILNNLLSNAIKFTHSGCVRLSVTLESPGQGHRFEVTDTGIGFDPAVADRIFSRFEQADGSITRQFGGTGLGLSISRDLATLMGGELTARSTPGEGSTFVLTLPLRACEGPAPLEAPASPAHPSAEPERPLRILVADDHATNRQVVGLILDSVGASLTAVENGAQAVEAASLGGFDLVLMDLQMPVMDGLTAIRRIRASEPAGQRLPILALSANALPEHVAAARDAGADGHIAKPITAPALLAAIEAGLAGAPVMPAPPSFAEAS